ncbi:prepilin-type N-terminal cleavage/methylation domain-containing protein [Phormidium sp. FACHB-592]|uniref:Prepilin-type N-terminal cleavage/methylation domain-containing protein n=1 Tax=Stenomitos frigidus AS-A4 TaxID=2933935 RepID=A0ABV0KNC9_9CYAN|nr:prepilin-type N-terminal cleavage/methylation domain-containing protein [Phormidium sp. FACHB-592]MBD2074854.1 prepilin-type N-terminal cleavage/methylation domain-containing protein [Phormidium sp. FACHB-592]
MAKHSFPWLLARSFRSQRKHPTTGFTLLELLISVFIGGIITSTLLYSVVELLKVNQRESSRAETQREMQLAMDYISAELRQAVFVYDGSCLTGTGTFAADACPGVTNFLPTAINTQPTGTAAGTTPVLAFWRVDPLPQVLINLCAANAANLNLTTNPNPPAGINGVPCLSRRTYSLVVYYLDTTNTGGTWAGRARLKRYALTQFTATGAPNTGWVDPTTTNNKFLGWPYEATGNNLQTAGTLSDGSTNPYAGAIAGVAVNPPVLVDFVDTPVTPGSTATACPGDSVTAGSLPPFVRSPSGTTVTSFYACVRGGGFTAGIQNNTGGRNQETAVFLRGNAAGRAGVPSTAKVVFDLQTRVLSRGSFEKSPAPQ